MILGRWDWSHQVISRTTSPQLFQQGERHVLATILILRAANFLFIC